MTHSIRGRLTVFLLLSLGLSFLASGGVLYGMIRAQLVDEFDRTLLDKAKTLMTLTEEDKGKVEIDIADKVMPEFAARADDRDNNFMPEFGRGEHPEYFMLWLASGALIARSASLGEHDLPRQPTLSNRPVLHNIVLPNGLPGRLIEVAFMPQIDTGVDDDVPEQTVTPLPRYPYGRNGSRPDPCSPPRRGPSLRSRSPGA